MGGEGLTLLLAMETLPMQFEHMHQKNAWFMHMTTCLCYNRHFTA